MNLISIDRWIGSVFKYLWLFKKILKINTSVVHTNIHSHKKVEMQTQTKKIIQKWQLKKSYKSDKYEVHSTKKMKSRNFIF